MPGTGNPRAMKHITSHENPFFKELKKLAGSARARRKSGLILLDGVHLLQSCVAAGIKPQHIVLTAAALQVAEIGTVLASIQDVPLIRIEDALFAELSDLKSPSGVLAVIARPVSGKSVAQTRFGLLLEDIQDPGNLGSVLRSASAAGCDAVFLSNGCADVWSPKVLRAAMGGHFGLPIHESADLLAVAAAFRGRVIAATLHGKTPLFDCDLRGDILFAVGNEGAGLSGDLLSLCGDQAYIPMAGGMESLNAAAAAAVCLFEAVRQRGQV